MFTQNFHDDFYTLLRLVRERHPFAFSRYNDGEARILKNGDVGNKDGWFFKANRDLAFRAALRQALLIDHPDFFYGISSEETDQETHHYLLSRLRTPLPRLTHGNIFSLANSQRFHEEFIPALRQTGQRLILIGSSRLNLDRARQVLGDFAFVPLQGCCVKLWNRKREHLFGEIDLQLSSLEPVIFLVCAGPLAKIIIQKGFELAPSHTYLDIGSSLDLVFFNRSWRADHREPEKYNSRAPRWLKT